jgi:hypothetical protein
MGCYGFTLTGVGALWELFISHFFCAHVQIACHRGVRCSAAPSRSGKCWNTFKCLERATKEMDIPTARKKETTQQATSSQHTQSAEPCVPAPIPEETKPTSESRGRIRGR